MEERERSLKDFEKVKKMQCRFRKWIGKIKQASDPNEKKLCPTS